ncbi:MAG: ferredoxin-type protein NapG [Clostridia bacterium]|nr:ferredoxin-type protein NapG [Clostridia bacterium]
MGEAIARRKLLTMFWNDIKYTASLVLPDMERNLIRPPGAVAERTLLSRCKHCGRCAEVCPAGAIQIAGPEKGIHYGTPYLQPGEKPCAMCLKCIDVCSSGALQAKKDGEKYIIGEGKINRSICLAWNGQFCTACKNACVLEESAIEFKKKRYPIIIREDKCIGCGQCVKACLAPVPAIEIYPR